MQHGWTLDKQKWKHLLTVVSGTHWSKTRLDRLYRDSILERPGVYVICIRLRVPDLHQFLFKALYEIIYVGKSNVFLHSRFLNHCRKPERGIDQAKECFGASFGYWYTEVSTDRVDEQEIRLIECFSPPANRISGRRWGEDRKSSPHLIVAKP
jgi:hypothetical protein